MNSDLAWNAEDPCSLRSTTSCLPSGDRVLEPTFSHRRSEFTGCSAGQIPLEPVDALRSRLALLLENSDARRKAVCQRWVLLSSKLAFNHPIHHLKMLERCSASLRLRANSHRIQKDQLLHVRTCLNQDVHAVNQAQALLDASFQAIAVERARLDPDFCLNKLHALKLERQAWERECQANSQLAAECGELRQQLDVKRERVKKLGDTVRDVQRVYEEAQSESTQFRRQWETRSQVLQEKNNELQALEKQLSEFIRRAETQAEARARRIEQLFLHVDSIDSRGLNQYKL